VNAEVRTAARISTPACRRSEFAGSSSFSGGITVDSVSRTGA
jgi:hypothetical protein